MTLENVVFTLHHRQIVAFKSKKGLGSTIVIVFVYVMQLSILLLKYINSVARFNSIV